eukprot:scaffold12089_cov176-Ochromonas_danica.AAC.8
MAVLLLAILSLYLVLAVCSRSVIEISPNQFREDVIADDRVWLIEFYSSMCGSCQEFAPTWEKVANRAKSVQKGQVNVDDPQGMALAEKLGVLAEGVPNIRLFARQGDPRGASLINGVETARWGRRKYLDKLKQR